MNITSKVTIFVFSVILVITLGCDDDRPTRLQQPLIDGYTLYTTVRDSIKGTPIDSVEVLFAWRSPQPIKYCRLCVWTDENGEFKWMGFPGTGPSGEMFRFVKDGYITKDIDVEASAIREKICRYRLEVLLISNSEKTLSN
jgi:hypothetical protein